MKTRLSILVMIGVMMTACYTGRPVAKQIPQNNDTYNVDYLFEHDGCKVYRFYDRGNYVYFTNCSGEVTAISTDSTEQRVQTVIRASK